MQVRIFLYSLIHWFALVCINKYEKKWKGEVFQATSDSTHIYAATLQVLQSTTVAVVDQPILMQNGQNNNYATLYNTLVNCIEVVI